MRNRYVIAMFVVFLIVSLTPASAINIAGINNKVVKNSNPTTDNIQIEIDQLQPELNELNSDMASLNVKADQLKNIWYNPLHWNEAIITVNELCSIANSMQITSNKLHETSKKIELESTKLESQSQTELKQNKENKSTAEENAELISQELKKRLNIGFKYTPTSNNFMVGDIVQYKSLNKYYRYLTVVRNEKTENFVVLEGSSGKNITVNKEQLTGLATLKLVPQKPINSTKIISTANTIQLDMINVRLKQAQSKEATAQKYSSKAYILEVISASLFAIAGTVGGIALAMAPTLVGTIPGVILGWTAIGLTLAAIAVGAAGVRFDKLAKNNLNAASDIRKEAAADLEDLNRYMAPVSHGPVANNMTLNTTMEQSINTTLNTTDPDGDSLKAYIITQPQAWNFKDQYRSQYQPWIRIHTQNQLFR